MSDQLPSEVLDAATKIRTLGGAPVVVASTDPQLPFVVFERPNLAALSGYVSKASDAAVGPLLAAVGLARTSAKYPSPEILSGIEIQRPFVIMRCVQALLADLGLSVKAQKKSL